MQELSALEELNLVKEIIDTQNQELLVSLYEKYEKKLLKFFYLRVGNFHDAENLLSDTFVKVLRNINNFRQESSFSTWLFTIANNLVVDYYRKNSKNKAFFSDIKYDKGYEPQQYNDDFEALKECLSKLGERDRSVIVMRYMEEETLESVAKKFNMSYQRVAQIFNENKENLLKCLSSKLGSENYG